MPLSAELKEVLEVSVQHENLALHSNTLRAVHMYVHVVSGTATLTHGKEGLGVYIPTRGMMH